MQKNLTDYQERIIIDALQLIKEGNIFEACKRCEDLPHSIVNHKGSVEDIVEDLNNALEKNHVIIQYEA